MKALGVPVDIQDETTVLVRGTRGVFKAPKTEIDCGNSGTTMRLLAGLLAAQPFETRLVGDASLSKRPMKRVIEPLTKMGAQFVAEGGDGRPPLRIKGGKLRALQYASPVSSAQVKSAILLAGMFAEGKTTVTEPSQSRDHTERMLEYFLVRPQKNGLSTSIRGGQTPESRDFEVPGDISSAAFWLVAAAANPESKILVRKVGLNETRTGVLGVLIRMGAQVREIIENEDAEPMGSVELKGARLKGTVIAGKEIPNVIDELPILAVAGALAEGTTIIRDARELRVKETDRIAAIATNLRAMGVEVQETEDGMEIQGGKPLHGATVDSFGDHRIAMSFAIAGLFAEGETVITGTDCVATSYPGFEKQLQSLLQEQRTEPIPVISQLPQAAS
jgi:3-phosphoshikimate 1-carboxyvinyltransferase